VTVVDLQPVARGFDWDVGNGTAAGSRQGLALGEPLWLNRGAGTVLPEHANLPYCGFAA
jgi:hypothetical protein